MRVEQTEVQTESEHNQLPDQESIDTKQIRQVGPRPDQRQEENINTRWAHVHPYTQWPDMAVAVVLVVVMLWR